MFLVPINYLAILTCGVLAMLIGVIWYGPLFGKEWMKLVGMTKKKSNDAKEDMTKTYAISFVIALLMAYTLAHFIWFTAPGAGLILVGIKTAIWAWMGFVVTVVFNNNLFAPDKKPMKLLLIESGYYLVTFIAMGVLLSVWW